MDRTARIIVGLVLDRSIGWGQPWADLDAEQCQTVAGGQLSYVRKVIGQLIKENVLRRQRIKGRYMYAVERPVEGDLSAVGRCRVCGHKGEIDLDPTWWPVPHDYFWHVPRACDGAMLYCMGIIAEATMRWDAIRRWPIVVPTKLILQDFTAGGYGRSTVIVALDKLEKLGFIGVDAISGQRSTYWVKPENFRNGTLRPERKLGSGTGEAKAKTEKEETSQASETTTEGRPVEFFSAPVGKCRRCGAYGPVDLSSNAPDELGGGVLPGSLPPPGDEARSRKRAGPSTASKPVEKWVAPPELRDLYAFLLTLPAVELPDEAVTREISAALRGAYLETLQDRCRNRAESIRRAEHPFKYVAAIARGIGAKYQDAVGDSNNAAARQRESELAGIRELSLEEAREWYARPELLDRFRPLLLEAFPELAK